MQAKQQIVSDVSTGLSAQATHIVFISSLIWPANATHSLQLNDRELAMQLQFGCSSSCIIAEFTNALPRFAQLARLLISPCHMEQLQQSTVYR